MAKIRVGFSSDFNVRDSKVGFGTTNPAALLDVVDILKADFNITGVATLTAYGGFVAQRQYVNKSTSIGSTTIGVGTFRQYYETEIGFTDLGGVHHGDDQRFNTLSEDLVIDDGQILNITNTDMVGNTTIGEQDPHNHSSYVCAGSLEQVSVTGHFSVPSGGINDRQSFIEGTVRFNTDLNTLEFFNGDEWKQFTYNQGQSGRMVAGGGSGPSNQIMIELINIPTLGNSVFFGDLTLARTNVASCSSALRGIWSGGIADAYNDTIDYVTIASGGDAIDFGNLSTATRAYIGATSSSTRGVFGGGYQSSPLPNATVNIIDYIEISTLGNALDFGDLFTGRYSAGAVSNGIKAVWGGGAGPGTPSDKSDLQSVTIAAKGNAIRFGDLSYNRINAGGGSFSNSVRGVFAGGRHPTTVGEIDYITIASEGNAVHFGDLTVARQRSAGSSTQIRGVWAGGNTPSGQSNVIDYVNIATTGDAVDFGDATKPTGSWDGCSDSHGGLGGF
tara:strand:+ start:1236 stop:2741 length:1506 start_codon:yes stop_codon:yes gene_type:complete